jgi:putative phosphoribosyl transferase
MFKDRAEAGRELANLLKGYKNQSDTIVVGIPRGGVAVAFEIAMTLALPLDIVVARKIGASENKECAVGAITAEGYNVFDPDARESHEYLATEVEKEKQEAKRRKKLYREGRGEFDIKDKQVILVDDGVATGLTMKAAIKLVRALGAKKIVVALPVSSQDFVREIKKRVDEIVCILAPADFFAVGAYYKTFEQLSDEKMVELMKGAESINIRP